jgi:hypothetical protein
MVYFQVFTDLANKPAGLVCEGARGIMKHFFTKRGYFGPIGGMDIVYSGEFHPVKGSTG